MLRADLIRPRLKTGRGKIWTQPIPANYHYLAVAAALRRIFEAHTGQSRSALNEALRGYEGDSLDYPVIRGLASVLESGCTFGNSPPIEPETLRAGLFQRGPVTGKQDLFHPTSRAQVMAEVAAEYELTAAQVENALFADLAEEQVLLDCGTLPAPGDLIGRYNLELARGVLYWAREVRLFIGDNYKDVFKYIKLFKLMYTVEVAGDRPGYRLTLHGPISPFVKSTMRYGLQFAKFLPALMLCEQWQLAAEIQPPRTGQALRYELSDQTALKTHFKSSGLFDSQLEADFAAEFEAKYSGPKRAWELAREDELIISGDTVLIPDFSLTHRKDGRRVLIEIVGFWHPHYLRRKLEKVQQAQRADLILLVYESANVAEGTFEAVSSGEVLTFARKPVLKEVLAAAERAAVVR